MSQTKGLYVQRHENGQIHSVQIEDSAGMRRPMDPQGYIDRSYKPAINSLPDLATFTKWCWLNAISAAFEDTKTTAVVGYWDVLIESNPKRKLILTESFRIKNIDSGLMVPAALTKHLKSIPECNWTKLSDGSFELILI